MICLVFTFANLQGQVKFGAEAGLNLSTMTLKTMGMSVDPKAVPGFHIGMVTDITLIENLTLQPAFLFSTKGTKYKISTEEGTITPFYIDVPVNLAYSFKINPDVPKISVFAGPYFAYGVGGTYKIGGESQAINYGSTDEDDLKAFDMGVNFGAGVTVKELFISLHYGLGLANLSPATSVDINMKNRVFGISVAYFLGGK